eukprot:6239321-Amphidinium_carterae.3
MGPRSKLTITNVEQDGVTHADSQLYSLVALRIVPMGDKKAMELAQMVHQNLVLHVARRSMDHMLTYGWRLPPSPNVWGCYCDDYMQLGILDAEIDVPDLAARAEFKSSHAAVVFAYTLRKVSCGRKTRPWVNRARPSAGEQS